MEEGAEGTWLIIGWGFTLQNVCVRTYIQRILCRNRSWDENLRLAHGLILGWGGGLLRMRFGGLIFRRAYFLGAYYRNLKVSAIYEMRK